jgi:hypothetical protein
MWEKLLAVFGLVACLAVWAGMALGPARRHRLLGWPGRLWRSLRSRRVAEREAASVIERARRRPTVEREGNVYRPRSFDRRGAGPGDDTDDNPDKTLH